MAYFSATSDRTGIFAINQIHGFKRRDSPPICRIPSLKSAHVVFGNFPGVFKVARLKITLTVKMPFE